MLREALKPALKIIQLGLRFSSAIFPVTFSYTAVASSIPTPRIFMERSS